MCHFKEVANEVKFNNNLAQSKGIKHGKVSRNSSVILADLAYLKKIKTRRNDLFLA